MLRWCFLVMALGAAGLLAASCAETATGVATSLAAQQAEQVADSAATQAIAAAQAAATQIAAAATQPSSVPNAGATVQKFAVPPTMQHKTYVIYTPQSIIVLKDGQEFIVPRQQADPSANP